MGCKLSISVVHPSKSPKAKTIKEFPTSPIMDSNVKKSIPDDDEDAYQTVNIDAPDSEPSSARSVSSLDIYQYV